MKSLLMQTTPLLLLMTLAINVNAQEPIVTESTTTSTVTTNGSMETSAVYYDRTVGYVYLPIFDDLFDLPASATA